MEGVWGIKEKPTCYKITEEGENFRVEIKSGKDDMVIIHTYFLKCGIDLRYIQELLGHKGTKTTEIYTHVSISNISKIKSLLDNIDIARGQER